MISTNNHTVGRILLTCLLLVATVAVGIPGTALADHEEDDKETQTAGNPLDSLLAGESTDDETGWMERNTPEWAVMTLAGIDGQLARGYSRVSSIAPWSETPTNAESAAAFREAANENNETFRTKLNNRTHPSTEYDAHAITFAHEESDPATVYVVGDVIDGDIDSLRVLTPAEFNETGRTVDEQWVVDGDAAVTGPALVTNIAERIRDGNALDTAYQAKLAGRYCSAGNPLQGVADPANCDVRSTLWLEEEEDL